LNSDAAVYGGGNVGNLGGVTAEEVECHNQLHSAQFTLPPLSIIAFRPEKVEMPEAGRLPGKEDAKPQKLSEPREDN